MFASIAMVDPLRQSFSRFIGSGKIEFNTLRLRDGGATSFANWRGVGKFSSAIHA
jgi:hypothetical protein